MKIKVSNWRMLSDSDKKYLLEIEVFYTTLTNAIRGTKKDCGKKAS